MTPKDFADYIRHFNQEEWEESQFRKRLREKEQRKKAWLMRLFKNRRRKSGKNLNKGGKAMFEGLQVGMIIVVDTFTFPVVGRVKAFDDTKLVLEDAVRILFDGRHSEFARGRRPQNAEIEKTYSLYTISADFIGGWAKYPGGKIPRADD